MEKQNQSFHPKILISDHFNEITNQIDIKTETLLENQIFTLEARKKINETREKQIEKLNEIRDINLNHLPKEFNEDKYRQKWSHLIEDESIEHRKKIDKIKEELILHDCVLLENPNRINGIDLLITSWFYDAINLEFLK